MKREQTFKSILVIASFLSLFAFAFVNIKASTSLTQSFSKIELSQNQVESEDTDENRSVSVPDLSVLGRVWEIAHRFLGARN
jgi:hypothetical protein